MIHAKGDIVCCPECKLKLFRITRDLRSHEVIIATMFEPIGKTPAPRAGDATTCYSCNALWFNAGRVIHVERDAHTFQKEKAQE